MYIYMSSGNRLLLDVAVEFSQVRFVAQDGNPGFGAVLATLLVQIFNRPAQAAPDKFVACVNFRLKAIRARERLS